MKITKEESEAYVVGIQFPTPSMLGDMVRALRRHVAAEMRLEFEKEHRLDCKRCLTCSYGDVHRAAPPNPRHTYTADDWERDAHEALMQGS